MAALMGFQRNLYILKVLRLAHTCPEELYLRATNINRNFIYFSCCNCLDFETLNQLTRRNRTKQKNPSTVACENFSKKSEKSQRTSVVLSVIFLKCKAPDPHASKYPLNGAEGKCYHFSLSCLCALSETLQRLVKWPIHLNEILPGK